MSNVTDHLSDLLVYRDRADTDARDGFYAFRVLPFLSVPHGDPAPDRALVKRIPNYSAERLHLLAGLDWLLTVECDVLNLSIGPRGQFHEDDPLQMATKEFVRRGKVVVVAAGNYGPQPDSLQALARAPWVISVGAVDEDNVPLVNSSRGDGTEGSGPTCASYGMNEFVPGEGGTSFSSPRVAAAAFLALKCLELTVADLQDTLEGKVRNWSVPVRMPWLGIADTGWDPSKAPYRWGPVAASLLPRMGAIEILITAAERAWAKSFVDALSLDTIPQINPKLVTSALRLSAGKLEASPDSVGFGLVTQRHVASTFRNLTPSVVCALLGISRAGADVKALDDRLGTYWSHERSLIAEDAFGTGVRCSVSRVRSK